MLRRTILSRKKIRPVPWKTSEAGMGVDVQAARIESGARLSNRPIGSIHHRAAHSSARSS
jgi:hypothetical protein